MKTNVRFIDIHNHVLPTVDDGSKSIEMSVEMIKSIFTMAYRFNLNATQL